MKKSRKQKSDKRRQKKQKQAKTKRQGIPKMLQRDPALREALNFRHPLAACQINKDWQEHGMAMVIVARMAQTGIVFAAFLVDVLGIGLKDIMGDFGVSEYELDEYEFLDGVRGTDLVDCEYSLASDLVYGGLVWARKWQFKLPREHKIWMRLLDPRNLESVDIERFGKNGEPFLMIPEEYFDALNEDPVDLEAFKDPLFSSEAEPSIAILRRIGDIKAVIVDYMGRFEFEDDLDAEAKKRFGKKGKPEEDSEWINFLDWFLFECRLSSGDMIIDLFLERYKDDICPDVYNMIADWKKVFHGLFEVKQKLANGFRVKNLINEVDYTVYPTNVPEPLFDLKPGDFLSGRVVPALGFHVFSGAQAPIPLNDNQDVKKEMCRAAARMQTNHPALALMDNPEKLEKSREAVCKSYADFIEFFGKEEVLGTGKEIQQYYREFFHFQLFNKQDPDTGLSKAEEYFQRTGKKYKLPKLKLPLTLLRCKDAAMLCDPEESVTFLEEYKFFLDIFADPDKYLGILSAAEVVLGYLESDTISDVPFRRAVKRHPDNFKKVIDYYGEQEGFKANDIDALIQTFKPEAHNKIPSIVVTMDQEIANASRE